MKASAGDSIEIQTSSGPRQATILFVSKRYKNAILLGFKNFTIWTGMQKIKSGDWKIIGHRVLSKEEEDLSTCIVGGHVECRDVVIREATEEDRLSLPKMLAAGCALVEKRAEREEA